MAPIVKFVLAALCVVAINPVLGAPVASTSLGRRQLHGEGVACDAILTDTDNGVGYGTENAENNAAGLITSTKGGAGARRRQLDKIANGFANVANAAGAGEAGKVVQNSGDRVDGQLTDDAANAGTQVGGDEDTVLEQAGSDVPSGL